MLVADIAKLIGERFDPAHAQASPRLGMSRSGVSSMKEVRGGRPSASYSSRELPDTRTATVRPHEHERGWKDTLRLDSGDDVSVIMRFGSYRGRYLMHCHNLEHEDYDMMMRFDVV
jgi:FtsP/CotA-like multicopper oxidase with cupredoxin domain